MLEQFAKRGFNPVVIRAWRCAYVTDDRKKHGAFAFQSRRDPGMALRLRSRRRERRFAPRFQSRRDPGMALRHSATSTCPSPARSSFQSRRDPGMALRHGNTRTKIIHHVVCFNPVVIRAWRCARVVTFEGVLVYGVSIPS